MPLETDYAVSARCRQECVIEPRIPESERHIHLRSPGVRSDYQRARIAGRRVSSASAESVMNHLMNRRLTKREQMRWSMKGAHYLLQTRVELLDGRLEACFAKRFPHFRSPKLIRQ
jgi:hypothetical protein